MLFGSCENSSVSLVLFLAEVVPVLPLEEHFQVLEEGATQHSFIVLCNFRNRVTLGVWQSKNIMPITTIGSCLELMH